MKVFRVQSSLSDTINWYFKLSELPFWCMYYTMIACSVGCAGKRGIFSFKIVNSEEPIYYSSHTRAYTRGNIELLTEF